MISLDISAVNRLKFAQLASSSSDFLPKSLTRFGASAARSVSYPSHITGFSPIGYFFPETSEMERSHHELFQLPLRFFLKRIPKKVMSI